MSGWSASTETTSASAGFRVSIAAQYSYDFGQW